MKETEWFRAHPFLSGADAWLYDSLLFVTQLLLWNIGGGFYGFVDMFGFLCLYNIPSL